MTVSLCATADLRSLPLNSAWGHGPHLPSISSCACASCWESILLPAPDRRAIFVVALRSNPNVYKQYVVDEARLRSLAAALDKVATRHGYKIVFVPFQDGAEDDNAIHRTLAGMMRQRDAAIVRDWTMDVQELVDIFSGAETIVAMRLHAAILALAVGRDCTVLPYDQKVRELCSEMRLQHLVEADALDDAESVARSIENSMGVQWSRPGHFPPWSELTLTA